MKVKRLRYYAVGRLAAVRLAAKVELVGQGLADQARFLMADTGERIPQGNVAQH